MVPGLVGHFAEPPASPARLAALTRIRDATVRTALADAPSRPVAALFSATEAVGDDDGTRRPMVHLLRTVASPTAGAREARLEGGLAWERTETRGNGIHVPLAAGDDVAAAWGLRGQAAKRLVESLDRIAPDRLGAILESRVRTVNVFAGTRHSAPGRGCGSGRRPWRRCPEVACCPGSPGISR